MDNNTYDRECNIVGLVAYKGAGKTTLTNASSLNINRIGFADVMYKMVEVMGFSMSDILDPEIREQPQDMLGGKTIRYALQTLGTEWGRDIIYPSLWTDIAMRRIDYTPGVMNVFDNVRFDEEFDAIRKSGGKLVALKRPELIPDLSHSSEQQIARLQDKCDHTFINSGTIEVASLSFSGLLESLRSE